MDITSKTFIDAKNLFQQRQEVSVSLLQRHFRMGYNAASALMGELETARLVSLALPEGFRVLAPHYANHRLPQTPNDREVHARRVFETALFLVELKQTDGGDGHSEAFKHLKPLHIKVWQDCRKLLPLIAADGSTPLLNVCEWVANMSGEDGASAAYTLEEIRESLVERCIWWADKALWRYGDISQFRYDVSLLRQARYFHRIFSEKSSDGGHSRFELFVDEGQVPRGTSHRRDAEITRIREGLQREHVEHVVPTAFNRDHCLRLYALGASVGQVADFIREHLVLVVVLREEAGLLDRAERSAGLGLKTQMPKGWRVGVDSIFARLHAANITFTPPPGYIDSAHAPVSP